MSDDAILPPPDYDDITTLATATNSLPALGSLPSPVELLLRPPYHLIIEYDRVRQIVVQCSHRPSLSLLATYLDKNCRVQIRGQNLSTLTITNDRSAYAPAPFYDRITIIPSNHAPSTTFIALVPILAIIECVLGYERISTETFDKASMFHYRRSKAFDNI